jgi:2-polyprenyl-6-methoxyphenol hydroxylase-like FAD-dependent oxidoreductase
MAAPIRVGGHGLVLGASIAGLLTARVLSDHFDRVTVVERDVLPEGPEHRRGVPQDRHPHLLQVGGAQALDEFFPGILDELEAAGSAVVMEDYSRFHFDVGGHVLAKSGPPKQPLRFYLQTRPFLESYVRRRVRKLANVTVLDGHIVKDLASTDSAVTGARVTSPGGDEAVTSADLVVDAMGRGGRTPAFLGRLGFDQPAEEKVVARVAYSAQLVHWPIDTLPAVVVGVDATPERPIGMSVIPQENDTAMFWLGGMVGYEPPAQFPAMIHCAERFTPPDIIAALRTAAPIGPASQHRIPAAVWRRYDRMKAFPTGLLVIGDAICVFNPTYGQGMSVAALQAQALRTCLAKGGTDDLARRFFKAAAKPTGAAWMMAAAGDLAYPEAMGRRNLQVKLSHLLEKPLLTAAETDIEVYSQVLRVSAFVDPPSSLLSPGFLLRLLRGALRVPKNSQ